MTHRSIRARLTAIATAITVVVLAVAAVVVVLVAQAQLRANLDRALELRADQIEAAWLADSATAVANTNQEDRFAQVLDRAGDVVAATDNVAGASALSELPDGRQSVTTRDDLPVEDDLYRVLIRRFDVGGDVSYVVVGENVDDVRDAVRALMVTLALVLPLAAVVLAATVWWLVGRTLRPVERIRTEVASIGLAELDHRVPVPGTGDEIDALADTMNDMLARLETAAADQRRFVADVSHELRTPLTRLRTSLEVDLAHPDSDFEATSRAALGDAIDLQHLVDDLLFLARRDAGHVVFRREPVDLDVVVDQEIQLVRDTSPDGPRVDMSGVGAAEVRGDALQLTRLVRNLLANAARYAATTVRVALTHDDDGVLLVVADDGPGVPPGDRDRVFERFVRLDEARSGADGGTGLGLAIVRDIASAHGATVTMGGDVGEGAVVEVRFPAPSDPGVS